MPEEMKQFITTLVEFITKSAVIFTEGFSFFIMSRKLNRVIITIR